MAKPKSLIYSAVLVMMIYYGTALFCLVWVTFFPKITWMESLLYAVFLTEPAVWPIRMASFLVPLRGINVENLFSIFYLIGVVSTLFFLLWRKSWARKLTMFLQVIRVFYLLVLTAGSLILQMFAHMTVSVRWRSLSFIVGTFLVFFSPSVLCLITLTRPSVKEEFVR